MKLIKSLLIITFLLAYVNAYSLPLHIIIPVHSIFPSQMSLETVNVETVRPKENKSSITIGDFIDKNSSINSVRSGGIGQQTSVFTRGTNSNHTLFLINGSPITDHSTTNGLFDAGIDPVFYSTAIDIYKGSQSTLFGPGAVGGAVNINTSTYVQDSVTIGAGTNNTQSIGINKGFINHSGFYSIKAHKDQSDGYSVVDGGEPDGYNFQSVNFDSEHFVSNGLLKSTIVLRDSQTDLDDPGIDNVDYTANSTFSFYQLIYEGANLNFVIDRNVHDREYNNSSELDTYDSQNNHARISFTEKTENFDITAGTDISMYSAQFENTGSYNSFVDKSAENYAGFVNFDWINEKLIINGGIRRDWNTLHDPVTTYRLGTGYVITDVLTAIAGINTGFKAPTLYEMYGADNFGYTGNPNLKEETAKTYELGIVTEDISEWSEFTSKSTLFYTEITDQINYNNSTYTNDVTGKTKIQGWDYSSKFTIDNSSLNMGVMYVSAQDSSNTQMTRRPWLTANIGLDHEINEQLDVWIDWQYYGKHRDVHPTNFSIVDRDHQHYTNIGAEYSINENLIVDLSVNNVTDLKFERPYGYAQPGREISLSVSYNF